MRRAFAKALELLATENEKIIFQTGDLGFGVFDSYINRFPERYINAGVAEAQMIASAAGLALEGFRPICYSIASFATARPFEQIRHCLAYAKLPVIVVGAGRGLLYAKEGPTHHAIDDLALMTSLPGMNVIVPADPYEVEELLPQVLKLEGPTYFTIGKYGEKELRKTSKPIVGKPRLIAKGVKIALFCTGEIASVVEDALKILNNEGILPSMYHIHTVKPIDEEELAGISEHINQFVVIEEHRPVGGLYSAIELWNSSNLKKVNLTRLSLPDAFVLGNLSRIEVLEKYELDAKSIANKCREIWVNL
jgi:transketolase